MKEYVTDRGKSVQLDAEEIAAAVPESDKRLAVRAFVPCAEVDTLFLDRSYYLTPAAGNAETAFAVIRDGLAGRKVAAVARTVLFRRMRSVLIRSAGDGLVAHTLEFDHEIRDAAAAFKDIAAPKIDGEMLELAEHIIRKKRGKFDPAGFEDRYDDALAELIKARAAGKPLPKPAKRKATEPTDLMQALRESAKARAGRSGTGSAKSAASRRKASTDQNADSGGRAALKGGRAQPGFFLPSARLRFSASMIETTLSPVGAGASGGLPAGFLRPLSCWR